MGVEERDRTERKREHGEPPGSCVCHTHIQVHVHIEPSKKALRSQPGCPLPRLPCNRVRRSSGSQEGHGQCLLPGVWPQVRLLG